MSETCYTEASNGGGASMALGPIVHRIVSLRAANIEWAPPVAAFDPALDDEDHSDELDVPEYGGAPLCGAAWGLVYVDARGQESRRRVTVLKVLGEPGNVPTLLSRCHERQALRKFRADRIQALLDLHTGEVMDQDGLQAAVWAQELADDAAAGLALLAFAAHADGRLHAMEREVMFEYLLAATEDLEPRAAEWVARYAWPDPDVLGAALRYLEGWDDDETRRLLRYLRRLVDADGVLHAGEVSMVNEIMEATGAR